MKNKYFPNLKVGDTIRQLGLNSFEEFEVLKICDECVLLVLDRDGMVHEYVANDKMSQPNDYNFGFTIAYREWA